MKKQSFNCSIGSLLLLLLICAMAIGLSFGGIETAFASSNNNESYAELCKIYTDDDFLYQETKVESNRILYYENYVNTRFDISNKNNSNADVTDEWILKIIPTELFENKVENFLYIGSKYGFYIDYNVSENNYLVYLMLHLDDETKSGQYMREIRPLYYERYKFNPTTKKVCLIYLTNGNQKYYEKYSDVKKLYLKDVSFSGMLFNEMHLNQGEDGYIDNNDYGGYFFGNYYKFKGVSTQSGKLDFYADALKSLIGFIPLPGGVFNLGTALSITDIIMSFNQAQDELKRDNRGVITNENDYGLIFKDLFAEKQISKYGHLLKSGGAVMETDNSKNAVLFGIRNNCYVQNTFFISYRNQDNLWNTRFAGKVKLDIVEEIENPSSSTVKDIATGVESLDYIKSFDNGEKTELQESEAKSLYVLADSKHHIRFKAPINGIYTFITQGSFPNSINDAKGTVTDLSDGINQQLKVYLDRNEVLNFNVSKNSSSAAATLSILAEFTPNEIDIGQTKQLTIQPGMREYLLFRAENKATPFEFEVTGQDELSLQFAYDKYHNHMPNSISGNHLFGSRLAEYKGKYYLIVSNNSDRVQNVTVAISNISTVSPEQTVNDEIINTKVYELASDYSCSVNISLESDDSVLMRVYDSEHNLLEWTSNYNEKTLIFSAEAKNKYYLVLENILYKHEAIKLSFDFRPRSLNLGNNEIKKYSDSLLTKFTTGETRASYRIQSDLSFTVFDSDWKTVTINADNEYLLEAESTYYVNISGSMEIFNIDVNLICTTETSGVFPASGMVLIKYVPTRTTAYKVNGASQVEWYDTYMLRNHAYLNAGKTYYLKLEGVPGEQYSVNIVRDSNRIPINTGLTIAKGLYFFNIVEAGEYTLWVNCSETMSTTLTITDGLGNIVRGELHLKNEFVVINFEPGLYYLDLELTNGNRASISIDKN